VKGRPTRWTRASGAILIAAAWSAVVAAQPRAMAADVRQMDMKDVTYTGCLEAGSALGTFNLTHLTTPAHLRLETMTHDTARKAAIAPATLSVRSSSIDLSAHLGHEVSVTGTVRHEFMAAPKPEAPAGGAPSFTVRSLKLVAAACSHP
jgi:hypothetical protein